MLYKGQGDITLKCLVHRDLTEATDFGILYEKPSGDQARVDLATGCQLHETGKAIIYDVGDDTFFDEVGMWKFQSFAIFGGVTALGTVQKIKVHENLLSA